MTYTASLHDCFSKLLEVKPATLIRSRMAQYCCKDIAMLSFMGDILEVGLGRLSCRSCRVLIGSFDGSFVRSSIGGA